MHDDLREGVNLLSPEAGPRATEAGFEVEDAAPESAPRRDETSSLDKQQLANVKATITYQSPTVELPSKDPVLTRIEDILAENLGELYSQLPEDKREAFKHKGEEVASSIHAMMTTARVKAHQILRLLGDWLHLIPGVNVYFLQQEAKLKLDKVMDYVDEQTKSSQDVM